MLTASRALVRANEAEPLPSVRELDQLERSGFRVRRGQITMVAGQPGAMKSTFAQWLAFRMNVRTLYFSADMDPHDAITRLLAMTSGLTVDEVSDIIEQDSSMFEQLREQLRGSRIQFCFDSSPTLNDIADEIAAFVEVWNAYPDLIVIDNLMNVDAELGEEFAGLRLVAKEIHRMARETGAALLILHHMREEGNPTAVPERRALSGKISQLPERILGVAYDGNHTMRMGVLKNRGGKSDPSGQEAYLLTVDPERATFMTHVPDSMYRTYSSYGG